MGRKSTSGTRTAWGQTLVEAKQGFSAEITQGQTTSRMGKSILCKLLFLKINLSLSENKSGRMEDKKCYSPKFSNKKKKKE